jgi:hypothetical protein
VRRPIGVLVRKDCRPLARQALDAFFTGRRMPLSRWSS